MQKLRWMGLGALLMAGVTLAAGLTVVLTVDRGSRLPGPPPGIKAAYPFGAVDLGFKLASEDYEWGKVPQRLDPDEAYAE